MDDQPPAQNNNSRSENSEQSGPMTLVLQPTRGNEVQRLYLLVIGACAACAFPVILLIIVGLWPYRTYVGLGGAGLFALAVVAILYMRLRKTEAQAYAVTTQADVARDEQGLRHARLRPNAGGHYEIPLVGGRPLWIPENLSPIHSPSSIPKPVGYPGEEHYYHPQAYGQQ